MIRLSNEKAIEEARVIWNGMKGEVRYALVLWLCKVYAPLLLHKIKEQQKMHKVPPVDSEGDMQLLMEA